MTSNLTSDTWASIIGGGLAAAIVTAIFNVWWDGRKEQRAEDWEWRRYRANLVHSATFSLMELFFAARTEIEYLVGTLDTLVTTLQQLEQDADALVRAQGGPELTIAQFEEGRNNLLQPFRTYNTQQINLRWNQYEQKIKDIESKAITSINVLKPLVPGQLHARAQALFQRLAEPYVWNLPNARGRLGLFNQLQPEFEQIHTALNAQIETHLGRARH